MTTVNLQEASVPIVDASGNQRAVLLVSLLPGSDNSPWQPLIESLDQQESLLEPIQLLEDWEYFYEIQGLPGDAHFETNRADVLFPDRVGSSHGRLRPGGRAGLLPITVLVNGATVGIASLEIRSRKLDYLSHYRWMLRDIITAANTIVMERFAAVEQRFNPESFAEPETAYERFALLNCLLTTAGIQGSFQQIRANPDRGWYDRFEFRSPGLGIPAHSMGFRQLLQPGPRVEWPASPIPALATIPRNLQVAEAEATVDTVPNQFIRYALAEWLSLVATLSSHIEKLDRGPSLERARRETMQLTSLLTEMYSEPFLQAVGPMSRFPSENQVLQRREGYRDFLHLYTLVNSAARLTWSGSEDLFKAGQRDVATLYEYWAFLELLEAVKSLCWSFESAPLIAPSNGLADIALAQGREARFSGTARRLGHEIKLDVFFNRSFTPASGGSWTRKMRPDCSVSLISALDPGAKEPVWLHFDAKYRIDRLDEIFQDDEGADPLSSKLLEGLAAKRDDLVKMHAYRDAIRRTTGAYVLYPGSLDSAEEQFREYHEILPGLGAFALRPTDPGEPQGFKSLVRFLDDVLTHFASVITQDRRARYWQKESYSESTRVDHWVGWAPDTIKPPADTRILLGYVRSQAQLDWILKNQRYNVRAGGRRGSVALTGPEMSSEVIILYGPEISRPSLWKVARQPEIWARDQMIETGYPDPRGDIYICFPLGEAAKVTDDWVNSERIEKVRSRIAPGAPHGSPVSTTWLEFVK